VARCRFISSFCSGENEVNHEGCESEQAYLVNRRRRRERNVPMMAITPM